MKRVAIAGLVLLSALPAVLAQGGEASKQALAQAAEVDQLYQEFNRLNQELQSLKAQHDEAMRAGDQQKAQQIVLAFQARRGRFNELRNGLIAKIKNAAAALDEAAKADPKNVKLYGAQARMAGFLGDGKKALEALDKALALDPANHQHRLERGRYRYDLMLWKEARGDLEACLAAGYEKERCLWFKAQILFYEQRFKEAHAAFAALSGAADPQIREKAAEFAKQAEAYQGFETAEQAILAAEAKKDDLPRVKLVTSKGEIVVELFEDQAPNTVANFIALVSQKFYDGTRFHRVIPNFMAQGGDPLSKDADPSNDGQGSPGYKIADELGEAHRKHFAGYLSMANSGPNTNGSQFFLTHMPAGWLNGKHTVFGRVVTGADVVKKIEKGDTLTEASVLRKRNHPYEPKKLGE